MEIFITGGSGFVGRRTISRLVASEHTVRALVRSGRSADLVAEWGAAPVRGDLTDLLGGDGRPAWAGDLERCDAVVHLASRMDFWGSDEGFERDNHRPSVALFEAAAQAGVQRFVLISAAAVSTDRHAGPAVVDESTPSGRPLVAYARVKSATERALAAADGSRTSLVTLRPPFVWGAGMTTLQETVDAAAAGRFSWIDGGRHIMDFVHVDNLAVAIDAALTRGRDRGVYYVTDGAPLPIRDFFTGVLGAYGVDVSDARSVPLALAAPLAWSLDLAARIVRAPAAPPLNNWLVALLGRDRSYDITAARTELGYRPAVTFEVGLEEIRRRSARTAELHLRA